MRRFPLPWRGLSGKFLRRVALLCVCALVLGIGWSASTSQNYLPTLDGNVYAMDPTNHSLFMVLSKNANNSLVHVDYNGNLLHYATTQTNQAFENLVVLDNTIYAVLTTYHTGETTQELVSLSMEHTTMDIQPLLDLSTVSHASNTITWTGTYLPLSQEPEEVCLGGVDQAGNGYLLHWNLATKKAQLESILEGETIYKLKYVDKQHYVWIDEHGQAGQWIHGTVQTHLLDGLADTPNHVSTYQDHIFIADSASGNVYELDPYGQAHLRWKGSDPIGSSNYQYADITIFTTAPDPTGNIQVIGLCHDPDTGSNIIVSPYGTITQLRMGIWGLRMVLEHSWMVSLICFILLTALYAAIHTCIHSSQTAVRLSLCELLMAAIMLGSVLGLQYNFYQNTIREDARKTLQLIGGNLCDVLSSSHSMSSPQVAQTVQDVMKRIAGHQQYTVNVIWQESGTPVIGYDQQIPANYHVADVKSGSYTAAVQRFLTSVRNNGLENTRNGMNVLEYVYLQRITQSQVEGCVTVAQTENAILSGRSGFWMSVLPILAACPFLFAALIAITWRLLRPLGIVREALQEFYETGGGNQIDLSRIPKTELYQVGLVFNQLSHQTKVQFNTLSHINDAYTRLVPDCLCQMLDKQDVLELSAGEYTTVPGTIFVVVPHHSPRSAPDMERFFLPIANLIAEHGGMIVDHDETLGAFAALFPDQLQAHACARRGLEAYEQTQQSVMMGLFDEPVEFGVFGAQRLLYPLAVSGTLHRRQEVLSLLLSFDAVLVQSGGTETSHLRLLGWDGDSCYYEDPSCRPSVWQSQWQQAKPLWLEAMSLFGEEQFSQAMRCFARVLRLMPEDKPARWYLFRCESLRDVPPYQRCDTGLLFNWRDECD